MNEKRFSLSSEQTLRLAELRDALAQALPAQAEEQVAFPSASFYCSYCDFTCKEICASSCSGGCTGTCERTCRGTCSGGCGGGCGNTCGVYVDLG